MCLIKYFTKPILREFLFSLIYAKHFNFTPVTLVCQRINLESWNLCVGTYLAKGLADIYDGFESRRACANLARGCKPTAVNYTQLCVRALCAVYIGAVGALRHCLDL